MARKRVLVGMFANRFHPDSPPWMTAWLVIIIDNITHILINGAAITYIG